MREFHITNVFLCAYAYMLLGVEGAGDHESNHEPLVLQVTKVSVPYMKLEYHVKLVTDEKILKHTIEPFHTYENISYVFACPLEEDLRNDIDNLIQDFPQYHYMKYCLTDNAFRGEENKKKQCASSVPPELTLDFAPKHEEIHRYAFGFRYCPDIENIIASAKPGKTESFLKRIHINKDPFSHNYSETNTNIVEIYKVHYSSIERTTVWTEHIIKSPLLFDVEKIPDEVDDDFELSTESFGLPDKDQYVKMQEAFASQRKASKDYMVPQMLVPKEEMAIQPWQATTSHYINVKPLWKQLRQLMNVINYTIRRLAAGIEKQNKGDLEITTTTYSIDSTENTGVYLDNSEKRFPIPDIWCKLVRHYYSKPGTLYKSILIYIHNTPGNPDKIPKQCEKQIPCDFKKWSMDTLTEEQIKYAYCCQVTKNLLEAFFRSTIFNIRADLLDMEMWMNDFHALAIIAPKNADLIDSQTPSYHYEIAYDAETLEDGTSAYVTEEHEQLLYLCPAEAEVNKVLEHSFDNYISKNCLFTMGFKPDERKRCKTPVKPELEEVLDEQGEKTPCSKDNKHFIYNVGYRQCGTLEYLHEILKNKDPETRPDFNSRFLNSYSICFNVNQGETIWTHYEMKSSRSDNSVHVGSQDKIDISDEIFQLKENYNLFRQMETIYAVSQLDNDPTYMVPHLMVPKEDKPSEYWQKITSHYVNTAPLWINLEPLMNLIEERIRKLGEYLLPISVYTRIFNLEDRKIPRELSLPPSSYRHIIYIPDIWCKLVLYKFQMHYIGIAIYLHNTPGNPPLNTPDNPPPNPLCELTLDCDFKRWSEESSESPEIPDDLIQYAYCCAINENVMDIFTEKLPIRDNLNLNDLTINKKFK